MVSLNTRGQAGEGLAGLLVMAPDCDAEQVAAAWHHLEQSALDTGEDDDLRAALDVAHILADLHLDTDSLCAALLHAPVARGTLPLEKVHKSFGRHIATLVDGVVRMDTIRDYAVAEGEPAQDAHGDGRRRARGAGQAGGTPAGDARPA
jgi:(p)ppGpp synthase/HD superfamily hydrolase